MASNNSQYRCLESLWQLTPHCHNFPDFCRDRGWCVYGCVSCCKSLILTRGISGSNPVAPTISHFRDWS